MARDPHLALRALLPRLVAFARTIIGDAEAARDLVQEAAARAIAARRVPDVPSAYRAWLFRIVRNAAIDELRRRLPEPAEATVAERVDLWNFDSERIAKITVDQALGRIAPAHREMIALIDIAGFSYAEAADLIGTPVGTVMSRVARARMALLAAIETSTVHPMKTSHGH